MVSPGWYPPALSSTKGGKQPDLVGHIFLVAPMLLPTDWKTGGAFCDAFFIIFLGTGVGWGGWGVVANNNVLFQLLHGGDATLMMGWCGVGWLTTSCFNCFMDVMLRRRCNKTCFPSWCCPATCFPSCCYAATCFRLDATLQDAFGVALWYVEDATLGRLWVRLSWAAGYDVIYYD